MGPRKGVYHRVYVASGNTTRDPSTKTNTCVGVPDQRYGIMNKIN